MARPVTPPLADVTAGPSGADTCELRVGGIHCGSCATRIDAALRRLDGVEDVRVDVMSSKVRVAYRADIVHRVDLAAAIRTAGYTVTEAPESAATGTSPDDPSGPVNAPSFWSRRGRLVMATASGVALGLGLVGQFAGLPRATVVLLLAVATIAGGWYVAPQGLRAARQRALDMNFLMTIAAAGAWIIGEQTEAAATLFLFAVAELLESYSMDRARNAITALMDLSPAEASVRRNGTEVRVPVSDVAVGETVVVRPGERIAVDGVVVGGGSSVNQATITGESMPVDKEQGADVFAGSLNGHGVLEVRSTKPASDTTLARIIHAVAEAQASRAPSQTFVDRFARLYTPAVVAIAVLLAIVPPVIGAGSWDTWIYRALAMLVVACPCALVISTPVSFVSGLAGAARAGVLIKGGVHLEALAQVTVVAIDKTGTLTEGRPAVADVVPLGGVTERELLARATAVERHSEHPIGRAIASEATARDAIVPSSSAFEALPGRGAGALLLDAAAGSADEIFLGNARLVNELGVHSDAAMDAMRRFESEGKTAIAVMRRPVQKAAGHSFADGPGHARIVGVIAVADRPRPEAKQALFALRDLGVRRIVMLTGDNRGTAGAIAAAIGVDEMQAELLPDDKVRIVRELAAGGAVVAFVGDGVNDAPALAAASVGIAMGAAGTDVALETADVALMADDLTALARAMRLARKTRGIVKQNIGFSLAIKAIFLVLAVGGWATLWMAVAADMGASLLVVANGLRTRRPD